jgi:hypothetical protein
MRRCSTCQHWTIGAPDASGLLRTSVLPGSRAPLGECTKPEFPRMPHLYMGGDCGSTCDRWQASRAEMLTVPEFGSSEEGGL